MPVILQNGREREEKLSQSSARRPHLSLVLRRLFPAVVAVHRPGAADRLRVPVPMPIPVPASLPLGFWPSRNSPETHGPPSLSGGAAAYCAEARGWEGGEGDTAGHETPDGVGFRFLLNRFP